ncbi:MAG: aminoacyl-tRNA hydrolase [Candidatus Omnitrophica bacterium]|nr:aminoacyl-tRNA hydrolase [Candidatus Omnitrophota bacterium]
MRVIFGLGNPGSKYKGTRHNIGYRVVEALAEKESCRFKRSFRLNSSLCQVRIGEENVLLIKPHTFMNNSGVCVKKVMSKYKVLASDILAVYDDVDLLMGAIRFRGSGSSGGHRGIASIMAMLNTEEISRLKVGIGRPESGADIVDYVLSDFSQSENKIVDQMVSCAVWACCDWVKFGSEYVMKNHNRTIVQ